MTINLDILWDVSKQCNIEIACKHYAKIIRNNLHKKRKVYEFYTVYSKSHNTPDYILCLNRCNIKDILFPLHLNKTRCGQIINPRLQQFNSEIMSAFVW